MKESVEQKRVLGDGKGTVRRCVDTTNAILGSTTSKIPTPFKSHDAAVRQRYTV